MTSRAVRLGLLAATSLPLWLAACLPIYPHLKVQVPKRVPGTPSGSFRAAAVRVDLTPIPGFPIGGYSIEGKFSRGFWTRLWARVVYLEDASGRVLVLVSTNLMIMPNGLSDQVASLVRQTIPEIGRENLLVAATETHQSPGNFFTDAMHNEVGSPEPGFDLRLLEFLARRIAAGVVAANGLLQPAKIQLGYAGRLDGIVRNRSFEAFLLNPEASGFLDASENAGVPLCAGEEYFADPRECRAVDPTVEVLDVRAVPSDEPIATAVFLATHTTVHDQQTEVYSGDLFEVTATLLERGHLEAEPSSPCKGRKLPVVAIFNGAQGDATVNFERARRDRGRLLELGREVADEVCESVQAAQPVPSYDIGFRFAVADLSEEKVTDAAFPASRLEDRTDGLCHARDPLPGERSRTTAVEAKPGFPQMGGAEDGRSLFHEMGLQEGRRDVKRRASQKGHGMKESEIKTGMYTLKGYKVIPIEVGKIALEMSPPTKSVPIGVYRIGDVVIAGLPGEFTTILGSRVRELIHRTLALAPGGRVLLVGFANGHISYITTPEEYDAQHYEGASNLFGPDTGPLLGEKLGCLAKQLKTSSSDPNDYSGDHEPGMPRDFELWNVGVEPRFVDDGLGAIAEDPTTGLPRRDFPTCCWHDAIPSLEFPVPAGGTQCASAVPAVSVRDSFGKLVTSNEDLGLVTLVADVGKEKAEWCAVWLADEAPPGSYHFEIAKLDGSTATCPAGMPPVQTRADVHPLERPAEGLLCDLFDWLVGPLCGPPAPTCYAK